VVDDETPPLPPGAKPPELDSSPEVDEQALSSRIRDELDAIQKRLRGYSIEREGAVRNRPLEPDGP